MEHLAAAVTSDEPSASAVGRRHVDGDHDRRGRPTMDPASTTATRSAARTTRGAYRPDARTRAESSSTRGRSTADPRTHTSTPVRVGRGALLSDRRGRPSAVVVRLDEGCRTVAGITTPVTAGLGLCQGIPKAGDRRRLTEHVNVSGGAIALGHPLAASGFPMLYSLYLPSKCVAVKSNTTSSLIAVAPARDRQCCCICQA